MPMKTVVAKVAWLLAIGCASSGSPRLDLAPGGGGNPSTTGGVASNGAGQTTTGGTPEAGGMGSAGVVAGLSGGGQAPQGGMPPETDASFPDLASQYEGTFSAPPTVIDTQGTTDAPLLGNGDVGVAILGSIDNMTFALQKNEFWSLSGGTVRAMARLSLAIPELSGASYTMSERLGDAEVTGSFSLGKRKLATRSWVQADDTATNLVITELKYEGDVALDITASVASGSGTAAGQTSAAGSTLVFDVRADVANMVGSYPTRRVRVATRAVGGASSVAGGNLKLTLSPSSTVYLASAVMSNSDAMAYQDEAVSRVGALDAAAVATHSAAHRAWWKSFYAHSFVQIPDKLLEKHFYASLYLLASTSRTGEAAPGLWGSWALKTPAWRGDYTLNYNYEVPFYAAFPTNHVELADAYDAPIIDWLDIAKAEAAASSWQGAFYRVHLGPLPNGSSDKQTWNQKSCGAFAATDLLMHYYYTADPAYAKKIYETIKQLAIFWEHYLTADGARYIIENDAQHEGNANPQTNGVMSLGFVRSTLRGAIDLSTVLNVDPAERAIWQDRLSKLADYPTFMRNGQKVFRYTEVGLDWNNGNSIGIQHIYPGNQIGLGSEPGLLSTAQNMVAQMARWSDDNGTVTFYPAAARVGHDPTEILAKLKAWISARSYPNLHLHTGGGGIENVNTVPSTLSEMLLQSFQGKLILFADWPKTVDARFGNLRSYGAFLLSSDQRSGKVQYVRLISEVGGTAIAFEGPDEFNRWFALSDVRPF